MIPRNRWPESLMAFLADHSTVTVEDIAYGALRSPGGFNPDESALIWIRQALASMRWRQSKGALWRKPARA
jgi:hypothetical protein